MLLLFDNVNIFDLDKIFVIELKRILVKLGFIDIINVLININKGKEVVNYVF